MSVGCLALALVLLLLHTCKAGAGDILINPANQTVPLNTITSFFCRAWGRNAQWYINGTNVDAFNMGTYENQGFTFSDTIVDTQNGNNLHDLNITVIASVAVNTTTFTCVAYLDRPDFSEPAQLIVMGAPPSPDVLLRVVDATTLQLSWEPPFTWPQYDILQYTVSMENRSNGVVLDPVILTPSDTTHTITASAPTQSCAELRFSVTAHTALGASTPAVIAGGFPIAPVFNDTTISSEVAFSSDGTPSLRFMFQLPQVCPFQELSWKITLLRVDTQGNIPIVSGPRIVQPYANERSALFDLRISRDLVYNARYSAIVNVNTSAGMSTSSTEHFFDTNININFPTTTEANSTTEATATTDTNINFPTGTITEATATTALTETLGFLLKIIIPVAVGILILIVAITVVLIGVIFRSRRYRFRSRRASKDMSHPRPMVPNPIYEGPVYETIDSHFHPLTPCRDPPHFPPIESNLDNKFTVLNRAAVLPLSGTATATVPTDTIPSSVRSEDNYTVMSSARATAVPVQPANNDNNTIRYVQDPSGR